MLHGWYYLTNRDKKKIKKGILDSRLISGPFHIELNWIDRCNAKCIFCNAKEIHSKEMLSFEHTVEILNEARANNLKSIRLAGGGEPSIHPQFNDLLRFLAKSKIQVDNINTNGIHYSEETIRLLSKVKVFIIIVSLNFTNPLDYDRFMGMKSNTYKRVLENIAKFKRINKKVVLQFFVVKRNISEIPKMFEIGKTLNVDRIIIGKVFNIPKEEEFTDEDIPVIFQHFKDIIDKDKKRITDFSMNSRRISIMIKEYKERKKIRDVSLILTPKIIKTFLWNKIIDFLKLDNYAYMTVKPKRTYKKNCYIPWYSLTITGNGDVYPCCMLMGGVGKKAVLNNINGKKLMDVWKGEGFREFRKSILGNDKDSGELSYIDNGIRCDSERSFCVYLKSLCDEKFYKETYEEMH